MPQLITPSMQYRHESVVGQVNIIEAGGGQHLAVLAIRPIILTRNLECGRNPEGIIYRFRTFRNSDGAQVHYRDERSRNWNARRGSPPGPRMQCGSGCGTRPTGARCARTSPYVRSGRGPYPRALPQVNYFDRRRSNSKASAAPPMIRHACKYARTARTASSLAAARDSRAGRRSTAPWERASTM
jgi:hypothetical protein